METIAYLNYQEGASGLPAVSPAECFAVLGFVALAALFGSLGARIGRPKGRARFGFWMGATLGTLGLLIVALSQPKPEAPAEELLAVNRARAAAGESDLRPCPWCAEPIRTAAVLCRFCGREVPADG